MTTRKRILSSLILAGLSGAAAFATDSFTLTFSKPTNTAPETVTLKIDPGEDVPVTIPAPCSAVQKRNLIKEALIAKGYDVPNTGDGTNQLVVQYLTSGTKVTFDAGKTGEKKDEVVSEAAKSAEITFSGLHYQPFDTEGLPAVFTAGIVTDIGELTAEVSAEELMFQTDGPVICQALFQRLAPQAPMFGAGIQFGGDRLIIQFDPTLTVEQGGITFGTTSPSQPVVGSLETLPAPCIGDINGDGSIDLTDMSLLLAAFGSSEGAPGYSPAADLDANGQIDLVDLSLLLSAFGAPCS